MLQHANPAVPKEKYVVDILARSATDRAFRDQLISDPRAAIASFAGVDASQVATLDVAFIEKTADLTIVVPPIASESAIDDAELESVSGGTFLEAFWANCEAMAKTLDKISDNGVNKTLVL